MATIIQKDVLIEAIAQIQGFLSRNLPYSDSLNDDELFLCGLREHIYSTHHNQLDQESLLVDIMKIKEKYEKPLQFMGKINYRLLNYEISQSLL